MRQASKIVANLASEIIENDPRLSKKIRDLKDRYQHLRTEVETHFDQIEEDLWEWISSMQKEAQRLHTHADRLKHAHRFYEILGVKPGASRTEIKAAWRDKMKQHHPDRFASNPKAERAAAEQARQINQAYQELIELLNFTRNSR